MRITQSLALVVLLAAPLSAQVFVEHDLIVADRGNTQNGSDAELRRYTYTGGFKNVLPNAGSGALRGLDIARDGTLFVARGNQIRRYQLVNDSYVPDQTAFAAGTRAQNVAVHPVTGNVWCAFGVNANEARIQELDPAGNLLRTITDSTLVHPRSLAFDFNGNNLFVANSTGLDVLVIDPVAGSIQVHADLSMSNMGFVPTHLTTVKDIDNTLFVVGDFGGTQTIIILAGATGSTTVATYLNYANESDLTAPAGIVGDSYGNLYVACRDANMSTPGVYVLDEFSTMRPVAPYIGTEHINPIGVAFIPRALSLNIVSTDGVASDGSGIARIVAGTHQARLDIEVIAPDFPGRPYGIAFSGIDGSMCTGGNPTRPDNMGAILADPLDPRKAPLVVDTNLVRAIEILRIGGTGAVNVPDAECPGNMPGFVLHLSGLLDQNGIGRCRFFFPSLPCIPAGMTLHIGFATSIIDLQTQPTLMGLLSSVPTCVAIEG